MRHLTLLTVGWMALALPGCPDDVPDSSQFVAGTGTADALASLDASGSADAAGADSATGTDSSLGTDTAVNTDTVGDTDPQDTGLVDTSKQDVAPGDTTAIDTNKADLSGSTDATTGQDADTSKPPGDAGCAVNGCEPGKFCTNGVCLPVPLKATKVVAGGATTCALLSDGTAACWGDGDSGQLGDGKSGNGHSNAIPAVVEGLSNVTDIACGTTHCCAVSGGTVKCWGDNQFGGSSPAAASTVLKQPVAVPGISGATAVAAGSYHSCAIVADGKVKCWGLGTAGQLGDGNGNIPGAVVNAKIGSAYAMQVRAGPNHTCIRTALGTGLCWGYNENGELGDGNGGTSKQADSPVPIAGLSGLSYLSTGEQHGCSVSTGGLTHCWGRQSFGQLGTGGGNSYYSSPQVVPFTTAASIAAGGSHTCAATTAGSVSCWGNNGNGQLGIAGSSVKSPTQVPSLSDIAEVAAGSLHTCVRKTDGSIWCFGDSSHGQCGPLAGKGSKVPVQAW